jgi:hypothetical protein
MSTNPAEDKDNPARILDTVERVSEMCFGLFMALTFVGAVSVATADDPNPARTMFAAALGCNLAWGLVDAVMYLVRTLTIRGKRLSGALAVKKAADPAAGRLALAESLPPAARALVGEAELETIRARLVAAELPERPRLHGRDYVGAVAIFFIVVATTFPVALPFLVFEVKTGLVVSRALTLVMLFGGGLALGHFAGFGGWKAGFGMTALGVVLTIAIIALGG